MLLFLAALVTLIAEAALATFVAVGAWDDRPTRLFGLLAAAGREGAIRVR